MAWFNWYNGLIIAKNPDEELLGKMRKVAQVFGANIIGDEGERY